MAGQVVTVEVMSESIKQRVEQGDLALAVLDTLTGAPGPYYGGTSLNHAGLEGTGSLLFDLVLPLTGDYVIEIFGAGGGTTGTFPPTGEYEFIY